MADRWLGPSIRVRASSQATRRVWRCRSAGAFSAWSRRILMHARIAHHGRKVICKTGQAVRFKRIGPPCTNRGGPVVDNYRLSVLAYVASRWHVDCCGSDAGDCRAQFETGRRRDKVFRARRRIFSGLSASQSAAMARQPLAVALTVRSAEAGSQVGGWSVGRGPSSITLQSRNNVAILRLNSVSALGFTAPGLTTF